VSIRTLSRSIHHSNQPADSTRIIFGLKPWPFYMVFSLFICPSIGRLASLVCVAISTKVLTKGAVMGNGAYFGSCEQTLEFVAREG